MECMTSPPGSVGECELEVSTNRPTAHERHLQLLSIARVNGQIKVTQAARQLDVSVETVRRDLSVLEDQGLIRRMHGSAYPVESAGFESDLRHREGEYLAEKRRIAIEAARHLETAESIFIDEGFSPSLVAHELPDDRPLTVVTASLPVATMLAPRNAFTVIMLGGRVRGGTLGTVDHWATRMLSELVIDLAFIGANGISRTAGLTTPDPVVAEVKRAAIGVSRRRLFLGVSLKFRATSLCRFATVGDFDILVTDTKLPTAEANRFAMLGPTVLRV
jgi:DeoR/GlpR family transcriptional regulator of sugar metabolism